ncbi:BTAD domain-containing putative transcriptional regulator [Nonomuraea sp. NPDC049784]|uniref:AfsR/SARP family transcriptional regulator n=1 Tax=Nonomuraea sp. NPDC049784 TaxID=3154361 RepID=UPI0033F1F39D
MPDGVEGPSVDFRILGPLEARVDGVQFDLPGRNVRWLLGALLLDAPRTVPEDTLISRVWGPSGGSTAALRTAASRLRRWLPAGITLSFTGGGYSLTAPEESIDATRFLRLMTAATREPDPLASLGEALALWRGSVLADTSEWLRNDPVSYHLAKRRLACACQLADHALAAGRAAEAVSVVERIAEQFPYDESVQARVLALLGASGRIAAALHRYEQIKRRFALDLGIDPSPLLTQAHSDLLQAGDAQVTAHAHITLPLPNLLPADIPDFTGRAEETATLTTVLSVTRGTAPPLAVVSGPGGVGKTTLAVHVAHLVRERYPHGQLYIDLRGDQPEPTQPSEVLGRFLRALGASAADIPPGLDERAEVFRGLLSNRRLLLVLDNAASPAQLRPILPGVASCGVLVTSRRRLGSLATGCRIDLGSLAPHHALSLLARIVGAHKVDSDRQSALRLAELVGFLPLAIRIAGAKLAAKSHWDLRHMVSRLTDERRRLDELAFEQLDVRTGFALSYGGLPPVEQRAFHLLSLLDAPDFATWVTAAVLDTSQRQAEDMTEHLVDARLLGAAGGRYRFHDLVRLFARERSEAPEERSAGPDAITRALGGWLFLAQHVYRIVYGGDYQTVFGTSQRTSLDANVARAVAKAPLDWVETERQALVAATRQALRLGQDELAWELACTCAPTLTIKGYIEEASEMLTAAQAVGDPRGRAAVSFRLALLRVDQERYGEAEAYFAAALRDFVALGDRHGYALTLSYQAAFDLYLGRPDDALRKQHEALQVLREVGDQGGEAYCLRNIGQILMENGDHDTAHAYLRRALSVADDSGSPRNRAQVLYWTGSLHLRRHEPTSAEADFEQVLAMTRQLGDVAGEAMALLGLGTARNHSKASSPHSTIQPLEQALSIGRRIPSRRIEIRVLHALGQAYLLHSQPVQAAQALTQAASMARELGLHDQATTILQTLAST